MKKDLLLLLLFISFGSLSLAQSFDYDVNDVEMVFQLQQGVSQDEINHGFINNLMPNNNNLYWVRNEIYLPDGWGSAICDKTACYFESVGERALNLFPNEQSIFDLHLYTHGMPGDSAVVELCVYEAGDTSTTQCKTYTFHANASATQDLVKEDVSLKLTPNPTTNYFTVVSDETIGNVEIYNIIGSKLKSYNTKEISTFNVSDLPSGLYLVRIYNESNSSVLSTLRLKKR